MRVLVFAFALEPGAGGCTMRTSISYWMYWSCEVTVVPSSEPLEVPPDSDEPVSGMDVLGVPVSAGWAGRPVSPVPVALPVGSPLASASAPGLAVKCCLGGNLYA